jgi:hypothetical protein
MAVVSCQAPCSGDRQGAVPGLDLVGLHAPAGKRCTFKFSSTAKRREAD